MQLNPIFANSEPLKTPGTYYVRLYFNSDRTVQAQVSFTVNAYVVPPFPLINAVSNPNGMMLGIMRVFAVGSGSILAGRSGSGDAVTCLVVKGTIKVTTAWQGPAGTPRPPQHTTMQYYVVGGSGKYHPLGPPVYSDTNPTVSSFDTTTLPDGSYIIWAKIIDMNDVSHSDRPGAQHDPAGFNVEHLPPALGFNADGLAILDHDFPDEHAAPYRQVQMLAHRT
jgi:hypothetical protein